MLKIYIHIWKHTEFLIIYLFDLYSGVAEDFESNLNIFGLNLFAWNVYSYLMLFYIYINLLRKLLTTYNIVLFNMLAYRWLCKKSF